jgi:hypothetical protein
VLAATSQTQLVRWTATINLMELASVDGMEEAFDSYAGQLATAKCGTWVRSHFLLFLGEGLERLNRFDAAEKTLEEAVAFAGLNQIHEIEFRAQAALSALRSAARSRVSSTSSFVAPPTWVPEDVASVVQAISDLRKAAVAAH